MNFYKYNEVYSDDIIEDNAILFTESIRNVTIISELSKLVINNNHKIKIIITKSFNFNDDFNIEISNFIKKYKIPVLIIEQNLAKIIYDYFIEGKGNIFDFIKEKNQTYEKHFSHLFDNEKNTEKENKSQKDTKANEKNEEKNDNFIGIDSLFDDSILNNIDTKKLEKQREILYNKLINEPKMIFKLATVKLSKRLIYDIICSDYNKLSQLSNIFGEIGNLINIFDYLCLEYYFDVNLIQKEINFYFISSDILKEKINKYLLFLSSNKINNKEWLLKYFDYLKESLLFAQGSEKNNSILLSDYLSKYNICEKNKTSSFNKTLFSQQNIFNDVLLFFSKNCLDNNNFPYKIFLDLIETRIKYLLKYNFKESIYTYNRYYQSYNEKIKLNNDCKVTFIFKIMNNLYEYYINNINNINNKQIKESFISSEIHNLTKKLIYNYIDFDTYFYNKDNEGQLSNSKIRTPNISLILEYTFKYFDYCIISYLRKEDKFNLFDYWSNSINDIFKFYRNYKLLTVDKISLDYCNKEIYSFLALIYKDFNKNKDRMIKISINDSIYNLFMNKMNIYSIEMI